MEIHIPSLEHIHEAAETFIDAIGDDRIIAFYGKMGSGKTTFIKAICENLGVNDVINSPTFAIVNEYLDGEGFSIYHFDFYRIKKEQEALDIGLEEYFDSGCLCLIEWPECIERLLPFETRKASITENPDGSRTVVLV